MQNPDDDRLPVRRALVSVYDKTGLDDLARALHEAGVALVSTGSTAGRIADAGVPVTKVEELTGFPECLDGRVKTLHPKVHAGILADRRLEAHRDPARRARHRAVRPRGVEPVPVHGHRDERRLPGRVHRADRHRRPLDGPRRRQEPPLRRDRHLPGAVRRGAGRRARGRHHPRPAAAAGRRGVRAHRDVRRRTSRPGWATWSPTPRTAAASRPGSGRPGTRPRCSATARTPTSAPRSTPPGSRPRVGWRRPPSCTARRCPTTTTSTRTRPAGRPTTSTEPAVAIIKHANPCGIAVGADVAEAHRKAHACDPVTAFGGVIATNVPVTVGDGRAGRRDLHRGGRGPRVRRRRRRGAGQEEEHPAHRVRPRLPRRRRDPADLRRDADAGPRRGRRGGRRRRGRPVDLDPGDRRPGLRGAARGPRVRVARLPGGEVQRDPARLRTAPRSASAWARSTGSTPAGWPWSGRGSGPPARSPPPTRSSRSPTARRSSSTPGVSAIVQPGGSVRDEEVVEALKAAGVTMYLTGTRHFFH